jgi:phosphopantothenoylcysteine decarboxylase/phosphopantothenate--cysteine ligase
MGLALAEEAARRGAEVTLVAANVSLPRPAGVETIDVETAEELEAATRERFAAADVLLMAAAVADFRPADPEGRKIKKAGRDRLAIDLEPTADILKALGAQRRPGQTLVGFAAEHGEKAAARAREKLAAKGLDLLVVNDISRSDVGFDAAHNEVSLVSAGSERRVERAPKGAVAAAILDEVQSLRTAVEAPSTLEERS